MYVPALTSNPLSTARRVARRRSAQRGMTLIEVLITVALITLVMGMGMLSLGVTGQARMKRSSSMLAGAIRVAYGHANATSKTVRLVFDFDNQQVILEESSDRHLIMSGDVTGGAEAATDLEKSAQEAAEKILEGPRAPRASFTPTKAFGFDPDKDLVGKELATGIRFYQVEVEHQDEPVTDGRAYLYFFPGGQTQRAAIQLSSSNPDLSNDSDFMTLSVSPLTGKVKLDKGRVDLPPARDEEEASERRDIGF